MNNRIDELMVQAGARFEFLHGVHYDDFQYKEFARLIIDECIVCAQEEILRDGPRSEHNMAVKGVIASIQEHFGVKNQ